MTLHRLLLLSAVNFCLGMYGMVVRRNVICIIMAMELMFNAAIINFVAFAHYGNGDATAGSIFPIFIIAVTACEMAAALAIILTMYRKMHKLDVHRLDSLNG